MVIALVPIALRRPGGRWAGQSTNLATKRKEQLLDARWVLTCMLGQSAVLAGFGYFAIDHLRR
jgi:hypothetical protein